jgi:alkanesulfonate monooxygenase SsuD/methylene tetrahydromethanopterin reductase-like flavin-dependent oxidoreductase (luciferase family)
LHEAVEQIQYAEELGFDAVWLAEHHFTRFGTCPSLPTSPPAPRKSVLAPGLVSSRSTIQSSWPRRPPCWTC